MSEAMTAADMKGRLYARHPGNPGQMPGPWTVIEELRGIDLLAFSAWSSAQKYARVGYEVKVSRSDLRRELLAPHKRALNVAWCNEFYFALPADVLAKEEIAYVEPDWLRDNASFVREPCPDYLCRRGRVWDSTGWRKRVACEACGGLGYLAKSRAEREAPTVWIPSDVGLVVVDGRGTRVVKPSPKRKEVPALTPAELGKIVRWVSMRPDPRHHPRSAEVAA